MCELVDIFVGELLAIHLLDALNQQPSVQPDEVFLWQFTGERGNILMLHVGVGVEFRACGSVLGLHIVREELHLVEHFPVLLMLLAVYNKRFCDAIVALSHECLLDLVLYVLHFHAILDVEMAENFGDGSKVDRFVDRIECFEDRIHDLVERESFFRAVTLGNGEVVHFHAFNSFI